jgi:hypothetical protein
MINIAFITIVALLVVVCISVHALLEKRKQLEFFDISPPNPCDRCRYLSGSPYLKCALHPSVALTAKAMDCKDYHPKQEKKLVRSSRRLLEVVQNILLR